MIHDIIVDIMERPYGLLLIITMIMALSWMIQSKAKKRLKGDEVTNGELALALVKNRVETGITVNPETAVRSQRQIKFDLEILKRDGTIFSKKITPLITVTQMNEFQPNTILQVLVDEEHHVGLISTESGITQEDIQELSIDILSNKGFITKKQQKIVEKGITSHAKILKINVTGSFSMPLIPVELELEVTKNNGEVVPVTIERKYSKQRIEAMREGSIVEVKYMDNYPDEVAIITQSKPEDLLALFN